MKVWAVEQGCYEDYEVVGVYSTEENANRVRDELCQGDSYLEPTVTCWDVDRGIAELDSAKRPYVVLMRADGILESSGQKSPIDFDELKDDLRAWCRCKVRIIDEPDKVYGAIWAEGEQEAIAVLNAFRLEQIALGNLHVRKARA